MNTLMSAVLTIMVILILVLFGIRGYKNGLVKSIISAFSVVATVALVVYLTPYISDFVENATPVHKIVQEKCEKAFNIDMNESDAYTQSDGTIGQIHEKMIDQLKLPEIIKEGLKNNNNLSNYQRLGIKNFNEYVPKFIADMIVKAMCFVITWIVSLIILINVIRLLKLVVELPPIKGANRVLGIALGVVQGVVFVWFMFMIITMFGSTYVGARLLKIISESTFLEFLYSTNVVLHMIQYFAANIM